MTELPRPTAAASPAVDSLPDGSRQAPPQLAVIVPTFNERDNLALLYQKIAAALKGVVWEMIVVDDDSRDGTAELAFEMSRTRPNLRCLRRIGRRGLASACVEGFASTAAPYVAVIDADHQHDETALPAMLNAAVAGADLVIGSRFLDGGSASDGLSQTRLSGSRLATELAKLIAGQAVSDPMSGFFLLRRETAMRVAPQLSQEGFKILIDLIVSSTRMGHPLTIKEVPYQFRPRHAGESKMSPLVVIQFLGLWVSKLTNSLLPPSFLLFGLVGGTGLIVHLLVLWALTARAGVAFAAAQILATIAAMSWNFTLNNNLTYADRKLKGGRFVSGLLSFFAICALGGIANISVASAVYSFNQPTLVAGFAGAIMSSVFNYMVTKAVIWRS